MEVGKERLKLTEGTSHVMLWNSWVARAPGAHGKDLQPTADTKHCLSETLQHA